MWQVLATGSLSANSCKQNTDCWRDRRHNKRCPIMMLPNWGSIGPWTSRYCASKELFIILSWLKEWEKTIRQTKAWLYKLLTSHKDRTRHNWSRAPSSPSSSAKKSAHKQWETWLPAILQEENRQPKSACIDSRYVCISLPCCLARPGHIFFLFLTLEIGLRWVFSFVVYS